MAELTVRQIEPTLVIKLKERAKLHNRTVEDEHRAILRETLLESSEETNPISFEAYVRTMPNVGTDTDFSRIEGTIRDVELAD